MNRGIKAYEISKQFETPSKINENRTADKTLKSAIMERISSNKKRPVYGDNSAIKQSERATVEPLLSRQEGSSPRKELILSHQSQVNSGYYEYINWLQFHRKHLEHVDQRTVEVFWKILRIVNYGEVLIPTGLVYDLMNETMSNNSTLMFSNIINRFLKENEVSDSLRSFKQLQNFMSIQAIQQQYKSIPTTSAMQSGSNKKNRPASTDLKSQPSAFDRNFTEAKKREEKRVSLMCASLVEQQKNWNYKPDIHPYKRESHSSLVKPSRVCHDKEKWKTKTDDQKYQEACNQAMAILAKAKKLDRSIFEGNIEGIPGVNGHLSRNKYCQAERLRVKRKLERPCYSSGKKIL